MAIIPFTKIKPISIDENFIYPTTFNFFNLKNLTDVSSYSNIGFMIVSVPDALEILLKGQFYTTYRMISVNNRAVVIAVNSSTSLGHYSCPYFQIICKPNVHGVFKIGLKCVDTVNLTVSWSDLTDANINHNIVYLDVIVNPKSGDSSPDMPVELDLYSYLETFGMDISSNDVKCFKCGSALQLNNDNLVCENSHTYTKSDFIYEHSSFLNGLVSELAENKLCGIQLQT